MWLNDFEEAITAIKEHCKWSCFDSVAASAFGDSFIFQPRGPKDFYFVYFRDNKKIVKQYFDTWRKPDHYEVIYEGDE